MKEHNYSDERISLLARQNWLYAFEKILKNSLSGRSIFVMNSNMTEQLDPAFSVCGIAVFALALRY